MANTRSKIDGKTKQRGIENIFYDDAQEDRISAAKSSKNKISANKIPSSIRHLEADQLKQEDTGKEQMHTFSETGAGVPAFLAKLWRLVDDPDTNHLICWNKDGRSFIIQNQAQFARELLPLNYKHNNMASFIRQLNMYGFHKITSIDNGGLKFDRDEMEFSHPCFKRNCPYLLEHIKRKIANTKSLDDKSGLKPEAVTKVLQDVKAMRGRQDSLDSRFSVMKQENEALWREIASLRQKHAKQQQIVNKLIQFLITIVQPSRNMTSVKRHMQLMIHDTPDSAKLRKKSESESECGPVIHELGEELLDEVADPDIDLMDTSSPYGKIISNNDTDGNGSPLNIERPHSSISQASQHYEFSNQSAEDAVNAAMTAPSCGVGGSGNANATNSMISQKIGGGSDSSIIQSINPDGSQIVYHVTEVPDVIDPHHNDFMPGASPSYSEENVLTTPMVREQMARTQQLKQRNKRRRKQMDDDTANVTASTSKMRNVGGARQSPQLIKCEKKQSIDPMAFLNDFPDDRNTQAEFPNVSSNLKDETITANRGTPGLLNAGNIATAAVQPVSTANNSTLLGQSTNFYNPNDFITSEMPADIFEESPLMPVDSYNQQQQKQQQQLQYGRTMANSGKFSSFVARGNNNGIGVAASNGASTSAAAAAAANQFSNDDKQSNNGNSLVTSQQQQQQGKNNNNGNNMSLAKYKSGGTGTEEVMRLSTGDEVNDHLENVQDELESLKDLLRSDGYSLDANTLLCNGDAANMNTTNRISLSSQLDGEFLTKLFNDSDILGPYGLNLVNESNNEKKGSELMSYQPMYDLSDIIDINEKNELEEIS
ncbi:heat shock factor protein isoform X3 [Zeugodacus cucurbitae]|uniref:heat shock factor protein isoform X3 n=1 Tax=Zeugodacus cucurbitae TaxID=28588 RepID=UPI0023D96C17|nr:heat shock factor protein isoform X3 [Zeugodacus cucurbitae]